MEQTIFQKTTKIYRKDPLADPSGIHALKETVKSKVFIIVVISILSVLCTIITLPILVQ